MSHLTWRPGPSFYPIRDYDEGCYTAENSGDVGCGFEHGATLLTKGAPHEYPIVAAVNAEKNPQAGDQREIAEPIEKMPQAGVAQRRG